MQTASGDHRLRAVASGRWGYADITVAVTELPDALRVQLSSPSTAITRLHLRWRGRMDGIRLLLGDAWERSYGDLEWRGVISERVMPWYIAAWDGQHTHGYGVRTGARAFCSWQVDSHGMNLCADVRSGGAGVQLGERVLTVCEIVSRPGRVGESAFAAIHEFCEQMCSTPKLPVHPVYGSNDWYWAYGRNSAASVLTDTQRIVELSPANANRPFVVIDEGWQPGGGGQEAGVGAWEHGNEKFPDLPGLADAIRRAGARPGIWIRPLLPPANPPSTWRLPHESAALDPTVPEVREKVARDVARLREWGFELIKHDYTTFDTLGCWGSHMGASVTRDDWTFAAGRTRTTAEVLDELYRAIRAAAGDVLVIGCNVVNHLSAGHFEICRIGDDTSGTEWARTRRMGVNTLAFRGAQHGAFYAADPDCVGVTNAIPWELNRQWLDLVARSGTTLFVSLAPDALGAEQRRDLRAALARAARPQPLGEPLDWQQTTWPTHWRLMDGELSYDWIGADGAAVN